MAGIFVQTIGFASATTGVGLAEDFTKGIVDRFRSLPIARSAVLAGRTLGDFVRMVGVVLIMTVVGLAVGLRPSSAAGLLGAIVLTALFGFAFSWISAWIGLMVKDVETANVAGFVWLFPLTFASSAFVRSRPCPGWLQAFANHTPVTPTVDAVRRPGHRWPSDVAGVGQRAPAQRQAAAADAGVQAVAQRHERGDLLVEPRPPGP